jgi:pimeloyl-ACP methyl ester carboxylesterase
LGKLHPDATAVLPGISVTTLVVVGDEDTTMLPDAGKVIASHLPGATLVTLWPAKHMHLVEHHARFDRLVAEFATNCQTAITAS